MAIVTVYKCGLEDIFTAKNTTALADWISTCIFLRTSEVIITYFVASYSFRFLYISCNRSQSYVNITVSIN